MCVDAYIHCCIHIFCIHCIAYIIPNFWLVLIPNILGIKRPGHQTLELGLLEYLRQRVVLPFAVSCRGVHLEVFYKVIYLAPHPLSGLSGHSHFSSVSFSIMLLSDGTTTFTTIVCKGKFTNIESCLLFSIGEYISTFRKNTL